MELDLLIIQTFTFRVTVYGAHRQFYVSTNGKQTKVNNISLRLDLFQNFQDTEAEKAIMGSIVYCIHHKDGCKWSDELRKLKVKSL